MPARAVLSKGSLQHHKDTGNGATADGREKINGKGGKGKTEGQVKEGLQLGIKLHEDSPSWDGR